ncbi:MAG: DUF6796 family protein [Chitinophagales bacterium]
MNGTKMGFQNQVGKYGLYIAMFGALLGGIGDVLLLYHPDGNYEAGDYLFLADIPPHRLLIGAYLGILFIPFQVFGLAVLYQKLKPAIEGKSWLFFFAIILTLFPGIAYHATCAFTGMYLRIAQDLPADQSDYMFQQFDFIKLLFEPLGAFLALGFFVLSFLYSFLIWKRETQLEKWKAWFNPALIYTFCIVVYLVFPLIGNVLAPAGFNLSLFLFFAIIAYERKK